MVEELILAKYLIEHDLDVMHAPPIDVDVQEPSRG
jgi:hypothetical protein